MSVWRSNVGSLLDPIKHRCSSFESILEKSPMYDLRSDDFRIRYYSELYELLNDVDVVQRINIQKMRWLCHVVRMGMRRVFNEVIYGEEDDLESFRIIKSRKPCHRLVWCAEAPGTICSSKPNPLIRLLWPFK